MGQKGGIDTHTYYVTCPRCGANLDPGERCDCRRVQIERFKRKPSGTRQNATPGKLSPPTLCRKKL